MEPATTLIAKLGGVKVVSQITGTALTAPYRWQQPREKGGTNGRIPQAHISVLIVYARQNEIAISLEDFFNSESTAK